MTGPKDVCECVCDQVSEIELPKYVSTQAKAAPKFDQNRRQSRVGIARLHKLAETLWMNYAAHGFLMSARLERSDFVNAERFSPAVRSERDLALRWRTRSPP